MEDSSTDLPKHPIRRVDLIDPHQVNRNLRVAVRWRIDVRT